MKSLCRIVLSLLALAGSARADAPPPAKPPAPPAIVPAPMGASAPIDSIVALVNGRPIWRSIVDRAIAPVLVANPNAFRGEVEPKVIESLIDDAVVRSAARLAGVEVTSAEIDQALKDIADANKLDFAGLTAEFTRQGFTVESYRAEVARQIEAEQLFRSWLSTHQPPQPTADELARALAPLKEHNPNAEHEVDPEQLKQMVYLDKVAAARQLWVDGLRKVTRIERR